MTFWTSLFFVLAGALSRFLPLPPNVSTIGALALFSGCYLGGRWKNTVWIPFFALFVSDLWIGFHNTMWAVYLSFGITVLLGTQIRNHIGQTKIFKGVISLSLLSSILFFLITNFAVWMEGMLYPKTLQGLLLCYEAAIPFFKYSLTGDLFFGLVFFGLYEQVEAVALKLSKPRIGS